MDYDYIDEMADDVIRGDYGNGEERKRRLGRRYNAVQNRVNEKLGYDKRYPTSNRIVFGFGYGYEIEYM